MDLRKYRLSEADIQLASRCLHYQPFILSDDLQTGVAHSWLYGEEGGKRSCGSEWLCDRRRASPTYWNQFTDANARLRAMYEDWTDVLASRFPGGSVVDVGCNTGYFPIRLQQKGMKECAGHDLGDCGSGFRFLNRVLGTTARFYRQGYDFHQHTLPVTRGYDVAMASAVLCHLPDPLHFLATLAGIASKAVFLFTDMADTDAFTIQYQAPNKFYQDRAFPDNFDDTVVSRGLIYKSMEWLGFKEVVEIGYRESWLPRPWYVQHKALLFLR